MTTKAVRLREICETTETWSPTQQPRESIYYVDVSAVSSELCKVVAPQIFKEAPSQIYCFVRYFDFHLGVFQKLRSSLFDCPIFHFCLRHSRPFIDRTYLRVCLISGPWKSHGPSPVNPGLRKNSRPFARWLLTNLHTSGNSGV